MQVMSAFPSYIFDFMNMHELFVSNVDILIQNEIFISHEQHGAWDFHVEILIIEGEEPRV